MAEPAAGMVARRQLAASGASRHTADHWLRAGLSCTADAAGSNALGHTALRPEGYRLAAVLACGPNAVLSHRSGGCPIFCV